MKITFGRYSNFDTPIHRIDSRIKVFFMISLMVGIFISYVHIPSDASQQYINFGAATNFMILGIYFVFLVVLMQIAKVSFSSIFRTMKTMWFFIILIMLLNILIPNGATGDEIAFKMGSLNVSWTAIFSTCYIIIRLVLVVMVTSIVTSTTKPLDLTFAIEWWLAPFKLIKLPVHEIGMIISLALRFIPTLMDETDRIMRSQASRGVDFKNGKLKEKFKSIISLIVPLFMSAFLRTGDIADAMEARGYDPKAKRTRYRTLKWRTTDTIVTLSLVAITVLYSVQAGFGWNLINLMVNH